MSKQVLNQTEKKMMEAEKVLARELGSIRAGRANASLLEGIQVSYYGANTPLNQLAQISVPEARMLLIKMLLMILKSQSTNQTLELLLQMMEM